MEGFLGEDKDFGSGDHDFKYILDSDVFHNVPMSDPLAGLSSSSYYEYDCLFAEDPLLTASEKTLCDHPSLPSPPHITSDHSYSMTSQPNSPLALHIKQEDDLDSDFEPDGLEDMLPVSPENDNSLPLLFDHGNSDHGNSEASPAGYLLTLDTLGAGKALLTQANSTTLDQHALAPANFQQKQEGSKIKLELVTTMLAVDSGLDSKHHLPPTPPGSTASDSDGGDSPQRSSSVPSSPRALPIQPAKKPICHTRTLTPQLFTNIQKLPQSGPLMLSEEEKRTLRQEGYPIPSKLPLTKAEEKSLKKVRRKIKNKISAQESRRKKKEYLEALEKRMDSYTSENTELKRKVETLETSNQSLLSQLTKLQSIVNKISEPIKANSTQTGTCLMVLVLCFAVFLGSWSPHSFLSSSRPLPKLFSSPHSPPSTQLPPHPFFEAFSSQNAPHEEDISDPIFDTFGPSPASELDETDPNPYTTHSIRSRMLLSCQEEGDTMVDINTYFQDNGKAPLDDITPQVANLAAAKMSGAGLVAEEAASVGGSEGESGLEAYMMHPDMEAKIIPVDTMALINRSSNK